MRALGRLLAPLRRVRDEGREPSAPERRRLALVAALRCSRPAGCSRARFAGAAARCGRSVDAARARAPPAAVATARSWSARRRPSHGRSPTRSPPGTRSPAALAEAARGVDGAAAVELGALARALALGAAAGGGAATRLCRRARQPALRHACGRDPAAARRRRRPRRRCCASSRARRRRRRAAPATRAPRPLRRASPGLSSRVLPAGAAALAELASPGALAGVVRDPLAAWLAGFACCCSGSASSRSGGWRG